ADARGCAGCVQDVPEQRRSMHQGRHETWRRGSTDSVMAKRVLSFLIKTAASAATVWAAKQLFSAGSKLDLSGKVVLITGGSRGLGLALAQELGSRGARLALCARDTGELEQAREQLERNGIESAVFACDITKQPEITSLVERVLAHFGK